jgi:hypothetical protein
MKWFKFYGQDWLTDPKVIRMNAMDRLCFITLLCLASGAEEDGVVRNCDEETLIQLTHLSGDNYDQARGCLKRYEALHCVTLGDNGEVTVNNFDARQGENLTNAERQARYRERLKTKTKSRNESNSHVTTKVTLDKRREDKRREEYQYGEFKNVLLTENEYTDLCKALTPPIVEQLITELDEYIASTGKKYSSHRATLQAWARRRINEHASKVMNAKPLSI